MREGLIARASTTIDAPVAKVWDALVNPTLVKQYMFGTNVRSEWKKGTPIIFSGEWEGKKYEDKGQILEIDPERRLQYSHATSRAPNEIHTVTIELTPRGSTTHVSLSQDNNANEEARDRSQTNWEMMLGSLKKLLEGK